MKILIDNGHGENTPGKRSPDGKFREYLYAREIAERIETALRTQGYDAERIVKESVDVPLAERARRVNEECGRHGASRTLLVSIHVNAAGDGSGWMKARGWSAYTSMGKTKADRLADALYAAAERHLGGDYLNGGDGVTAYMDEEDMNNGGMDNGIVIRRDMQDGDPDWEESFYILTKTKCPAVLTENFFMDNEEDVAYLNSESGKRAIVQTHVDGIINYVKAYGKQG